MTNFEERAVEHRTRIREARFMLRSLADDQDPPACEAELRVMAKRLHEIETEIGDTYSVRKMRGKTEGATS